MIVTSRADVALQDLDVVAPLLQEALVDPPPALAVGQVRTDRRIEAVALALDLDAAIRDTGGLLGLDLAGEHVARVRALVVGVAAQVEGGDVRLGDARSQGGGGDRGGE